MSDEKTNRLIAELDRIRPWPTVRSFWLCRNDDVVPNNTATIMAGKPEWDASRRRWKPQERFHSMNYKFFESFFGVTLLPGTCIQLQYPLTVQTPVAKFGGRPQPTADVTDDEHISVAVAVFIYRNDRLLLGRRLSAPGVGTYALPGGRVEFGEDPEEAAKREVEEETGLVVHGITRSEKVSWASMRQEGIQTVTLFFVARCTGDPRVMELDKCSGWRWYDRSALPSPLFRPIAVL